MNKLLLLSIALLSVNLYGQERPTRSLAGLEGWGRADPTQGKNEGVDIRVEDYSNRDKKFNVKAIKNQVELKLKLAGIKINKFADDSLYIQMVPIKLGKKLIGYHLGIIPQRKMIFKHKGKSYYSSSSSKTQYDRITPPNYRESLDANLDLILLDYLKANPKKE